MSMAGRVGFRAFSFATKQPWRIHWQRSSSTVAQSLEPVTLFRYPICPFCCGTRAFLDALEVAYTPIDVNPVTKVELREHEAIKAWEEETEVKFKTVPVAIVDPDSPPISDSRDILNYFAERHDGPLRLTPDVDASLQWAYNFVKLFPVNIYRSPSEAWEVFQYISNTPLSLSDKLKVRVGGAALMWVVANFRIKKALGVNDPRAALCEGGEAWMQRGKLGEGEPFHGGDAVDMADVVVWGMLSSMTGMRTLSDLRANVPALDAWYSAVEATMPAAAQ